MKEPTPLLTDPFHLLLVDDNRADMRLMTEAIRIAGLAPIAKVESILDGRSVSGAIETAHFTGVPFDLILLDLNMPRLNGKQILSWIKSHNVHKSIPVFILTNSDNVSDSTECYQLGADLYLQKPTDYKGLIDFFAAIRYSLENDKTISGKRVKRAYEKLGYP